MDQAFRIIPSWIQSSFDAAKQAAFPLYVPETPQNMIEIDTHQALTSLESDFGSLPDELQILIFSYLPAVDLARCELLSRRHLLMCGSPFLWKIVFNRDKVLWRAFGKFEDNESRSLAWLPGASLMRNLHQFFADEFFDTSDLDQNGVILNERDWKKEYKHNYLENKQVVKEHKSQSISKSPCIVRSNQSIFNRLFDEKTYLIPMFGDGLEASAKKLVYRIMFDEKSPLGVTHLYPGVEGIGSGVGFTIHEKKINLAPMYKYEDVGRFEQVRPIWKDYFRTVHGFIFVVDPCNLEALKHAREMLEGLIPRETDGPILVLACINHNQPKVPICDLALSLNMEQFKERLWCIRHVDVSDLDGVMEGVSWLAKNLER
eukprot:TRINITY_DN10096_c0_g1_i1.p1 TRINITY_DN10096_c0_g1~~TRINITY_DN10096_c0_g1_i1.p1  ORF type:complete len:374 (+),score=42.64 TRINITY_DN10096_c0_g1_i1:63-1184(+)